MLYKGLWKICDICFHHHRFSSRYHASLNMTDIDFHTSAAGTFCKIFFTFSKMGTYGSPGQSVILSTCITAFLLVIEAKNYMDVLPVITLSLLDLHMEFMEHGQPIVKLDITGLYIINVFWLKYFFTTCAYHCHLYDKLTILCDYSQGGGTCAHSRRCVSLGKYLQKC